VKHYIMSEVVFTARVLVCFLSDVCWGWVSDLWV